MTTVGLVANLVGLVANLVGVLVLLDYSNSMGSWG